MNRERCAGCGAAGEGGTAGCRALYDKVLARDYSDPLYFECHKLVVDCYSLQHPDEFCRSAKSLAGHLVGLAVALDGGETDRPATSLKRWLDSPVTLAKPPLTLSRGTTTLSNLPMTAQAEVWQATVRGWAGDIWTAHTMLHGLIREWRVAARES